MLEDSAVSLSDMQLSLARDGGRRNPPCGHSTPWWRAGKPARSHEHAVSLGEAFGNSCAQDR